jgi:DNA replication protein DnaC
LRQRVPDTAATAKAKAAVRNFSIDRLVLFGPAGVGKTSIGTAAVKAVALERRLDGHFVDARSLAVARSRSGLGAEPRLVADAINADCLLLDDLGLDSAQQHGSAVADVVYARHAKRALLIVTLAIAPSDIAARYGDGIARRLLEDDGASVLVEVQR